MGKKKLYSVNALTASSGYHRRIFSEVEAVSERQAWYFFCLPVNQGGVGGGFNARDFNIKEISPRVEPKYSQMTLF